MCLIEWIVCCLIGVCFRLLRWRFSNDRIFLASYRSMHYITLNLIIMLSVILLLALLLHWWNKTTFLHSTSFACLSSHWLLDVWLQLVVVFVATYWPLRSILRILAFIQVAPAAVLWTSCLFQKKLRLSIVVSFVWFQSLCISRFWLPMQLLPYRHEHLFIITNTKVRNCSIAIRASTRVNRLRPWLECWILLLVFQSTNQVDALLNRSNWRNLVVHLHRLKKVLLRQTTNFRIRKDDRFIEEFFLTSESMLIAPAFHNGKFVRPAIGHLEVFLRWRKGTRWAFLQMEWSSTLLHDTLYIVIRFFFRSIEFLNFSMRFRPNIRNSWQFIDRACVFHSEASWRLFRFFVEVLSIEWMHFEIVSTFGYLKAIVPI